MQQTDDLYQGYLEEMHALENFRVTYTGVHEGVPLEREDPEVRRLIEAMAFFTARTRASALRNILATNRRLFQQFFSFLLSPLPSMGFMQATISGRFAEPATLPANSEVMVSPEEGQGAIFRTMNDLRILPIKLEGVDTLVKPRGDLRVALHFRTGFARNDEIGTLSFFINHLNDYQASLNVLDNLRKHVRKCAVVFDEKVTDETLGSQCEVSFGAQTESDGHPHAPHPVQRVRLFFHFPQRELYLNVKVPAPPRNWKKFSIFFDLAPQWPKNLRLNPDIFQLFTVPIVNLRAGNAQPVLCDGTHERYPLRHPEMQRKFALHSVLGVYELAEKGKVALRPGIIAGGSGSFEVERAMESGQEVAYLKLNYPEAFEEAKKLVIEALWLQPWFSEKLAGRLSVALHEREIAGLDFELLGDVRPHVANSLQNSAEGLLQILAMKSKTQLSLDELQALLNALGTFKSSTFRQIPSLLQELAVSTVPLPKEQGGGLQYNYRFRLKEFDATYRPMVDAFMKQIAMLLNGWTPDGNVVIEAQVPGSEDVMRF
ncbi:MAG TPA: type VI secretion system baseplate subunit TssF/IglH [Planctomycetota bacterium]|nr:type VI secretion system baseplate subunit TssF/IglH [Planctomycetota bacterium]